MNSLVIAAFILAVTYILITFERMPGVKIDRTSGALAGAILMVLCGVLTLDQALAAVDLKIILFLLGMMIIVDYLRLAGFFDWAAETLMGQAHTPSRLLWLVVFTSGAFSAVFVNDTICLLFPPIVILIAERLGVRPQPYLIAVATAANIGSAATLIGNPQNMIIGIESQIPFLDYTVRVLPIVLVGLVANVVLVRNAFPGDFLGGFTLRAPLPDLPFRRGLVARALVTLAAVMVGFSLGWSYPLVAITGATALILAGDVDPHRVLSKVDWPLLLFFGGLFVVMGGVSQSGLSASFLSFVSPWLERSYADQLAGLLGGVTLLSNVISNVPAVLLFTPILKVHGTSDTWTMLALVSTFAGNLTLVGSVANLIVAGIARRAGHPIGFWEFLKVGVPLTLFTLMAAYTMLRIG